jgi:hypothetical protein
MLDPVFQRDGMVGRVGVAHHPLRGILPLLSATKGKPYHVLSPSAEGRRVSLWFTKVSIVIPAKVETAVEILNEVNVPES